jgi:hypothetical protein
MDGLAKALQQPGLQWGLGTEYCVCVCAQLACFEPLLMSGESSRWLYELEISELLSHALDPFSSL